MKKYSVVYLTSLVILGGAGFFLWANSHNIIADYPSAIDYAPNLWFDSEENYYPASPLDFYYDEDLNEIGGEAAKKKYDELSKDNKVQNFRVYYHITNSGSEIIYEYWFFYAYNEFNNFHYGDWESVFVFVDKSSKGVNKIVASDHYGTRTRIILANHEFEKPGYNHGTILVEKGSHASWVDGNKNGLADGINDMNNWYNSYGFYLFKTWSSADKLHGLKVNHDSPYYNLRPLDEIREVFGKKYSEDRPLISKEKSSTLGMVPLKIGKTKFYALPLGGSPPENAWNKDEFKDPQKAIPLTPSRIADKISNEVTQTVASAKRTVVNSGKSVVNTAKEAGESLVYFGATLDIPEPPFARILSFNALSDSGALSGVAGQTFEGKNLAKPKSLLSGSLVELVRPGESGDLVYSDSADIVNVVINNRDLTPPRRGQIPSGSLELDVREANVSELELTPKGDPTTVTEPETEIALVSRVIDGDTVELANGQVVRYIGIDSPELPNNCFAEEAKQKNRELAEGKNLIFFKGPSDLDNYGRLLRFAWEDKNQNSKIDSEDEFVNLILIEGGYAHSFNFGEEHAYNHRFDAAERKASVEARGLWSGICSSKNFENQDSPLIAEFGVRPIGSGVRAMPTPVQDNINTSPLQNNKEGSDGGGESPPPDSGEVDSDGGVDSDTPNSTSTDPGNNDPPNATSSDPGNDAPAEPGNSTSTDPGNSTSTDPGNATSTEPDFIIDDSPITINEIQLMDSEFVELYNNSTTSINLSSYYFSYYSPTSKEWNDPHRNKKFPDDAEIPGKGYYLIGLKDFTVSGGNPNADWQPYNSSQLNNSQGTVSISRFDPTSTTSEAAYAGRIDAVGWDEDFDGDTNDVFLYEQSPATSTPKEGESLSRNETHADSNVNSADFGVLVSPTSTNSKGETVKSEEPEIGGAPIWQMYQGDARRSGTTPLSGPNFATSTAVISSWVFVMDSRGEDSPVIGYDGTVYTTDVTGFVYAINSDDGSLKWKFDPVTNGGDGKGWSSSFLALSNDSTRLYSMYGDTDNNKLILYSIKTKDGNLDWKYSEAGGNDIFKPPAVDSAGNIYTASKHSVYSISASGILNWKKQLGSIWIQTPTIDDGGFIYSVVKENNGPDGVNIWKLDPLDGNVVWKENPTTGRSLLNPISIGSSGILYTGGYLNFGRSGLYAVNSGDGSQIWFAKIGDVTGPIPALDSVGSIYIGTKNSETSGGLNKISPSGDIEWSVAMSPPGPITKSVIVDSLSRIYVGTDNKFVYAIDSLTGKEIWSYELSSKVSGFAIGDKVLYVVGEDGKIYAFK